MTFLLHCCFAFRVIISIPNHRRLSTAPRRVYAAHRHQSTLQPQQRNHNNPSIRLLDIKPLISLTHPLTRVIMCQTNVSFILYMQF